MNILNKAFKLNPDYIFSKKENHILLTSVNLEESRLLKLEGRMVIIFESIQAGKTLAQIVEENNWQSDLANKANQDKLEEVVKYFLKEKIFFE